MQQVKTQDVTFKANAECIAACEEAERQWADKQADAALKPPQKRIVAVFQPQAWQNDYAIDVDGRTEVDVTEQVLALPLDRIHDLGDDDYDSDDLVDVEALGHNGPFYVEVVEQVCEFFGVEDLAEVTEDMLLAARQATLKLPDATEGKGVLSLAMT
jgi:hypothetical protein